MVDIAEARLFLPSPNEASSCDEGELDPLNAERVIRNWLAKNRATLSRSSVWDGTQIIVTCRHPSDEFPGQVVLYIGIPYAGHSFVAPSSCQQKSQIPSGDEPLPEECIPPPDLGSIKIDSYTIVESPENLLR
jgi:hypothetical protein